MGWEPQINDLKSRCGSFYSAPHFPRGKGTTPVLFCPHCPSITIFSVCFCHSITIIVAIVSPQTPPGVALNPGDFGISKREGDLPLWPKISINLGWRFISLWVFPSFFSPPNSIETPQFKIWTLQTLVLFLKTKLLTQSRGRRWKERGLGLLPGSPSPLNQQWGFTSDFLIIPVRKPELKIAQFLLLGVGQMRGWVWDGGKKKKNQGFDIVWR